MKYYPRLTACPLFVFLLFPLCGLLFLPAFIQKEGSKDVVIYVLLFAVMMAGVFIMSAHKKRFFLGGLMGVIAFLFNFFDVSLHTSLLFQGRMYSLIAFFCLLLYHVLERLAHARRISSNTIYAAIDGYLLIGIIGGFACRLVNFYYPESFAIPPGLQPQLDDFTYYSFVTLSSLGYGDITPLTPPAQSLALLLSISGQLYLAIVVGIIVGKFTLFGAKRK